jgi:hypothetical protein
MRLNSFFSSKQSNVTGRESENGGERDSAGPDTANE